MKKLHNSILAITCLLLFSCKKETINGSSQSSAENTSATVARTPTWQGKFISYNGLPPSYAVADKDFIRNGYARIYDDMVDIDDENYYATKIRLVMPASLNITGDSLNFEAGVKNPSNSSFFKPYYGRDVTLYLKGETNEAYINNTVTSDINPDAQKRAGIKLGQKIRNIPGLQYNFEDYGVFILQTFNRGVVAYRNDEYLGGLGYEEEPVIGRLKEIGVIFKGSGYIDYIKVYNSVDGKLLMSEDFNTDGQSTIVILPD